MCERVASSAGEAHPRMQGTSNNPYCPPFPGLRSRAPQWPYPILFGGGVRPGQAAQARPSRRVIFQRRFPNPACLISLSPLTPFGVVLRQYNEPVGG